MLRALAALVRRSGVTGPGAFWTTVVVLAAVVAAALVRYAARREARPRRRAGATVPTPGDAWAEAEAAAREGHYDVAAQRLYAAVVAGLARAGLVRAHASKTAGDYLRELRRARDGGRDTGRGGRSDVAQADVAQAFAPFARGYQAVVYGPRGVDRARYEALRASALPLLERSGA